MNRFVHDLSHYQFNHLPDLWSRSTGDPQQPIVHSDACSEAHSPSDSEEPVQQVSHNHLSRYKCPG